jgi:serine/threonine protein kinase/tetratricopeptide (TPR) repeat protein
MVIPMVGQMISHYKVIDELGGGGMGVVYKAHDTRLDRPVALKFLPPDLTRDPAARERFIHEAKAASSLQHPNICTIHDIDETVDKQLFIVMDYYEGETLHSRIARGQLSIKEALGIAVQVAQGLAKAHENGIIHRDVKPANIIIGNDGIARIVDFGLAKLAGQTGLTQSGSTPGTAAYMSPEQASGEKTDHRTDIWSLGVVLYEMLTGQRAFPGEQPHAVVYSILNKDPKPIQEHLRDASSDLVHVVNKLLEKNPEDRYQSMTEAVIEFNRMKRNASWNPDTSDDHVTITSKPAWVKRLLLGSAIAIVVGIIAAALFVFYPNAIGISPLIPNRIVVAEFENQTGDGSLDNLNRMAVDALTQGLAQIELVKVVPSSEALLAFQKLQRELGGSRRIVPAQDLGKATKANVIVSGALHRHGDGLQFQAQITDAGTGDLLAVVETVARPSSETAGLIEELRERVMGVVALKYTPFHSQFFGLIHPPTYKAFNEYATGYRFGSRLDVRQSIAYFKRAAVSDSSFFMASILLLYTGVEGNYAAMESIGTSLERYRDRLTAYERSFLTVAQSTKHGNFEAAYRASEEMRALAPNGENKYMCAVLASFRNNPRRSITLLMQVDQQSELPNWRPYWFVLTGSYHTLGQYEEELKVAERARALFPNDLEILSTELRPLAALGKIEVLAQRLDECLSIPASPTTDRGMTMRAGALELRAHGFIDASHKELEKALSWYHTWAPEQLKTLRHGLGETLFLAGQIEEARKIFEQLAKEAPDDIDYHGRLGVLAACRNDKDEAQKVSRWLGNLNRPLLNGDHLIWQARIAALLGERDRSVAFLREAFGQGARYGIVWHRDPDLESLHDYAPYKELMKVKEN